MPQFNQAALCIAATLAAVMPMPASAQQPSGNFPTKPVTVIIPASPGSSQDVQIRLYSPKLTEALRQPIVVDYKAGAGGAIGTAYVAKAAPDGHTLVSVTTSFGVLPAFFPDNPPYDPIKDFAPVSLMIKNSTMLVASPSLPVSTFPEYLAYAKAHPGEINFGTSGGGGIFHLIGAWLHSMSGTRVTFVHYKGSGPMYADMMAGRVHAAPAIALVGLPFVKSGKLKAIANLGTDRTFAFPDLKTVAEQGLPEFEYPSWSGFLAPARTPEAIVNRLSTEFAKLAKAPDLVKRFEAEHTVLVGSTPEQFRRIIASEAVRWRKVVQDNGIKLEE